MTKLTLIHEQSRSYDKIKSGEIVESLYKDFIPYDEIPDFPMTIKAPSGQLIEIVDDPAVLIGTAVFKKTNKRVAVIAKSTRKDTSISVMSSKFRFLRFHIILNKCLIMILLL